MDEPDYDEEYANEFHIPTEQEIMDFFSKNVKQFNLVNFGPDGKMQVIDQVDVNEQNLADVTAKVRFAMMPMISIAIH